MKRGIMLIMTMLIAFSGIASACAADSTPEPLPDDFDYFGAVPWEMPDDVEEMVVHSVHDGDSLKLTKPNDDWWEEYRIIGIQAPEIEGYRDVALPLRWNGERSPTRRTPPSLGLDTTRIMLSLGYTKQQVDELVERGIAVSPDAHDG